MQIWLFFCKHGRIVFLGIWVKLKWPIINNISFSFGDYFYYSRVFSSYISTFISRYLTECLFWTWGWEIFLRRHFFHYTGTVTFHLFANTISSTVFCQSKFSHSFLEPYHFFANQSDYLCSIKDNKFTFQKMNL